MTVPDNGQSSGFVSCFYMGTEDLLFGVSLAQCKLSLKNKQRFYWFGLGTVPGAKPWVGCCPEPTFGYRCVAGDENELSQSPETSGLLTDNLLQEQLPELSTSYIHHNTYMLAQLVLCLPSDQHPSHECSRPISLGVVLLQVDSTWRHGLPSLCSRI